MIRSLFAGVSGLGNHQTAMDVVANNIANVNTVGFKSNRVSFQDLFYQSVQGSSAPSEERGGTNPTQIGLGMKVGSIDTVQTQGSLQSTGNMTDLAIEGNGFFILGDGDIRLYSRAGNFDVDAQGFFVDKATGFRVQGLAGTGQMTEDLHIPLNESLSPQATDSITFSDNLDARAVGGSTASRLVSVFDSLGNVHSVSIDFTKIPVIHDVEGEIVPEPPDPSTDPYVLANAPVVPDSLTLWDEDGNQLVEGTDYTFDAETGEITASGVTGDLTANYEYYGDTESVTGEELEEQEAGVYALPGEDLPIAVPTLTVYGDGTELDEGTDYSFDAETGEVTLLGDPGTWPDEVTADYDTLLTNRWQWSSGGPAGISGDGILSFNETGQLEEGGEGTIEFVPTEPNAEPVSAEIDFNSVTQFSASSTVDATDVNGFAKGDLETFTIDSNGVITGVYSNGRSQEIGQIALAAFSNPAGLQKEGSSMFMESNNSGIPQVGAAATGPRGTIAQGSLEMSNVDLSREFTRMITTQRGFQANSRLITTSDEMLQELVNLKR